MCICPGAVGADTWGKYGVAKLIDLYAKGTLIDEIDTDLAASCPLHWCCSAMGFLTEGCNV